MGEVFLARQTGVLDRLAILKALRPDLGKEKDLVDQFLDEARVAATLNHPNIVAIYDVGEWLGTHYIAMEYIAGEDLSRLWYAAAKAGVGLPFQVSVRIIMEAALGLDHAHRAKDVRGQPLTIVHRDISPQNIMVRVDGVTKLVDFGIAKAANKASRTQAGMVKGKLQYMSPEQVRGELLDGRSDQFSLGVVLWEMCTGRRLFKADTEVNTLQKILHTPINKPSQHVPGFPAELEAVIMRMLERDAKRRFATLGEVATRLKEYLDRSAVTTGEVSVAAFVDQILGKELQARIADLTPMETNDTAATEPPMSAAPAPATLGPSKSEAQPAAREFVEATAVLPPEKRPERRRRPAEDGLLTVADGPVGDTATQPPENPDELVAALPQTQTQTLHGQPDAAADPFAPAPTGAFSLGALPSAQTGAWQLGTDFQALQAAALAAHGEKPPPDDLARTIPSSPPSPRSSRFFAVAVAAAVVVGVVGIGVGPKALRVLRGGVSESARTTAARTAIATDAPAALVALRATLEPLLRDGADVDALIAAALLDGELGRVQEVATALRRRGGQDAGAPSPLPTSLPTAGRAALQTAAETSEWSRYAATVVDVAGGADVERLEPFRQSSDPVLASDATATWRAWQLTRLLPTARSEALTRLVDGGASDERAAGSAAIVAAITASDDDSRTRAREALLERQRRAPSDPRLEPALRLIAPATPAATPPATTPAATPPGATPAATTPATTPAATPPGATPAATPPAATPPGSSSATGTAEAPPPEPETYETALAKGRKAQKAGRSKEALRLLTQALALKPGDTVAMLAMAWAQLDAGRHEAAAKSFRAVITANPSFVEAQFGLGEALRAQGKTTDAIAAFQRYLELAPTGPDADIAKNAIRALE
jgi:tetratricopeptide (TPR) repeat protein